MATPASPPPALAFEHVSFIPATHRPIFVDLSWQLQRGSFAFLAGRSGGGKSTLLRMATRLIEPDSGRVLCAGRPVRNWNVGALRRHISYVPQRTAVLTGDVGSELSLPQKWHGLASTPQELAKILAIVQLPGMALTTSTRTLSEGERSRLAVARALLLQPAILLLDEPTAALDPPTALALLQAIRHWASAEQRTVLLISHRLHEATNLASPIHFLLDGQLWGPFATNDLQTIDLPAPVARFCSDGGAPGDGAPDGGTQR